jgi:hypothetical protein
MAEKKFGRRWCRRSRVRGRGTSRARAPREREEAPEVALVHGLPLVWPVRGEPELAGGGAEGERRRGWVWARFSTRGALLECCEAIGVDGWSNAGL